MGASRGIVGNLPATALPRRQAPLEEMAPSCVALWSDTRISERRSHALPWTVGAPRGGAQPVRAGRTALDDERGVCGPPAVTPLHARLGSKLGVAVPGF